jgi:DNA-3-methyladenine glycosylase II
MEADGGPVWFLRPRQPFDLRSTALVLERSPASRTDRWDEIHGEYRRVLAGGLVRVRAERGLLRVEGAAAPAERLAVRGLLGLDADLKRFHAEAVSHPLLGPMVRRLQGLRPPRFPTVWEALLNGVACQQVSLASGLAALGRLGERYPAAVDGDLVALPPPEVVAAADLGGMGLSSRKQDYLHGLADAARAGVFDELAALPTPEAYGRLTGVRGVGRWTAEYVLLRGLGRLEVFPADDAGAARALADLIGVPRLSADEVRAIVEGWGPWRGMVYFCLLAWRRIGVSRLE